jgi:hypothetical protein
VVQTPSSVCEPEFVAERYKSLSSEESEIKSRCML